tara:strand:- start:179 stop:622 length:444 start_codon:yes stop_codon:yes gene_type:complete
MKKFYLLILIFFIFPFNLFSEETFLSLKKNKVNVRYGPSFESPIKYIYKKIHLPIKQIDKKENWRRIIDLKNNSGWIHISQLKKVNSLIPLEDKILFKKPSNFSRPIAMIKEGRVLIIKKCEVNWCNVKTKKISGWIKSKNIWGIIK